MANAKGRALIDEVQNEINQREIGRWECQSIPTMEPKKVKICKTIDIALLAQSAMATPRTCTRNVKRDTYFYRKRSTSSTVRALTW